jgi:GAF domain-containing protein
MIAQMVARLNDQRTLEGAVDTVLRDALAFTGTTRGYVRLMDETGLLTIVAQSGFDRDFLLTLRRITLDSTAPGSVAAKSQHTVVVENIREDASSPLRDFAHSLDFSSVQATPLVAHDSSCVGIVAIFLKQGQITSDIERRMLETYGKIAADRIAALKGPSPMSTRAQELFERLIPQRKNGRDRHGMPFVIKPASFYHRVTISH